MTKMLASLFALAVIVAAVPAAADCAAHKQQMTVQTAPVVTSDAQKTTPMTPVPPTTTKTGG